MMEQYHDDEYSWMVEHCSIDCLGNMEPLMEKCQNYARYVRSPKGRPKVVFDGYQWPKYKAELCRHRESKKKEIVTADETALVLYKGNVQCSLNSRRVLQFKK